ncbi:hypothetical protein V6N13_028320 [Hibiscus sabdariffa]
MAVWKKTDEEEGRELYGLECGIRLRHGDNHELVSHASSIHVLLSSREDYLLIDVSAVPACVGDDLTSFGILTSPSLSFQQIFYHKNYGTSHYQNETRGKCW